MNEKIFISYKSDEFDIANKVRLFLENANLTCWMAPMSIKGGCSYAIEIPRAIHDCKIFVLILSEKSQNSIWVPKELDQAINARKKIIPIVIENFKLNNEFEFYLSNIQRYLVYEQFDNKLLDILADIENHLKDSSPLDNYSVYNTSEIAFSNDAEIDFFGNIYTGAIQNGMPNGIGTMKYIDGTTYIGEWENGRIHGKGKLTSSNGIYDGQWDNDTFHGIGTMTYPNGESYAGEWEHGTAVGMGKLTKPDGTVYSGAFKEGKPNGRGIIIMSDGEKYIGEFSNGTQDGIGEMSYSDGSKYIGTWKNGKPHGKGELIVPDKGKMIGKWNEGTLVSFSFQDNTGKKAEYVGEIDASTNTPTGQGLMVYEDGTRIDGVFKNGIPNGPGKKKMPNGVVFEGFFQDGIFEGPGTIKDGDKVFYVKWEKGVIGSTGKIHYSDGTIYEGEWKECIPNGKGTATSTTGLKYEGDWKDGLYHGVGKLTYESGACYEGEWKMHQRHGKGKLTTEINIFDGVWEDDKFVSGSDTTLSDNNSLTITGNFEDFSPVGPITITSTEGSFKGFAEHNSKEFKGTFNYNDGTILEGVILVNDGVFVGTIRYPSGAVYEGTQKNGKRNGKGKLTFQGIVYEGEWQDDLQNGTGRRYTTDEYIPQNGPIWYEDDGMFENNVFKSGTYKAKYSDGAYFEGEWNGNNKNGHGKMSFPDGKTYDGNWVDGYINGYGILIQPDGSRYEGEFLNELRHGIGKVFDKDGNLKYEGEFKNGNTEGFGTFFYSNGDRHEGNWIAGEPYGEGIYYYKNGTSWKGTWENGVKITGNGHIYFTEGGYYYGNLKDKLFVGQGTVVNADGCKFEGPFSKGKKHGTFIFTNPNGERFKCKFRKGNLIESATKKI